jgi:hypothetical protein
MRLFFSVDALNVVCTKGQKELSSPGTIFEPRLNSHLATPPFLVRARNEPECGIKRLTDDCAGDLEDVPIVLEHKFSLSCN